MKKIIITVVVVSLIVFLAIFIVMRNNAGDTPAVVTNSELPSTDVISSYSAELPNSTQFEEFAYMVKNPPLYTYTNENSYSCIYGNRNYFIYDDSIYYFTIDIFRNDDSESDNILYKMNLDGTNISIFKASDELDKPLFYFVYKDEAYFHLGEESLNNAENGKIVNKKINLKTGEILSVNCDEFFLPCTLKDGIVKTYYNANNLVNRFLGNYTESKTIYWGAFDLNSNQKIESKEKVVKNAFMVSENFLDFDEDVIFYTNDSDIRNCKVYMDDDVLYEFETKPHILAKKDNYLFIHDDSYIYKLNIDTKQIEEKEKHFIDGLKRITSYNSELNYYYSLNNYYLFNVEKEKLEPLFLNTNAKFTNVFPINYSLVFTVDTENVKYKNEYIDNRGSVYVHNENDDSMNNSFEHVRKISFDEKYMYILEESNDEKYEVKKKEIK